jgi:hypothetical protein
MAKWKIAGPQEGEGAHQNTGASTYAPNTARSRLTISPIDARAVTSSMVVGIKFLEGSVASSES